MLHGKNHGFTLAEVLITLGIIGIVAAITLPNVIQNYQKKVASTRIKKAYTNLNKAIKMSEAQNEELKFWDFPTGTPTVAKTRDFVDKYIKPYFVDLKECSSGKDDSCGFWLSQAGVNYLTTNGTGIAILVGKNNTL